MITSDQFIVDILKEENINLTDQQKKEYLQKIKRRLEEQLGLLVLEELSDEAVDKLNELAVNKDELTPEKIQAFLKDNIKDFENKAKNLLYPVIKQIVQTVKQKVA